MNFSRSSHNFGCDFFNSMATPTNMLERCAVEICFFVCNMKRRPWITKWQQIIK